MIYTVDQKKQSFKHQPFICMSKCLIFLDLRVILVPSLKIEGQRFTVKLFQSVDDKLFEKIVRNPIHVLQPLIPDRPPSSYDLRLRSHDTLLLNKTSYLNDREFIIRMLYKDSY